jgi:hypothetical protein
MRNARARTVSQQLRNDRALAAAQSVPVPLGGAVAITIEPRTGSGQAHVTIPGYPESRNVGFTSEDTAAEIRRAVRLGIERLCFRRDRTNKATPPQPERVT